MKRKFLTTILTSLFLLLYCNIAKAQTEIKKYYGNEDNNYGVVYDLPKTLLQVCIEVKEQKYTPGSLNAYAEQYLSVKADPISHTTYEILSAKVKSIGVPDTTKRFLVIFNKKSFAPFVSLTNAGIIANINGNRLPPEEENQPTLTPWTKIDTNMPTLPETYNLATSLRKQAVIASQAYQNVKQSILDIATGNVEHMPKDGESMRIIMSKLTQEKKRIKRLFLGDTISRIQRYYVYITPDDDNINNRTILNFSPYYGIVSAIDLSGTPIKLDMNIVDKTEPLSGKALKKFMNHLDGIVYNLPGSANVTLRMGNLILFRKRLPITQVGTMQLLSEKMFDFENGKHIQVYFDINSGAIKNVVQ